MKKLIPLNLILLILLSSAVVHSQPWRKVTKDHMRIASGSYFLNSNIGWYSGDYMTIHQTTDAGITWTEKYKGSDNISDKLNCICFVNENLGFSGGTKAKMLKTTDGGLTWTQIIVSDAVNDIEAVEFIDDQRGWVLVSSSDSGAVFKTTNGGDSWTRVLTHSGKSLYDLTFIGTHGVVVGGGVGIVSLYYTLDGDNWVKAPVPSFGGFNYTRSDVRKVYMVNENLIYACGWGSTVGAQPSIQLKSTNGGVTWTFLTQTEENRTYGNLYGLYFKDELNGISAGGAAYPGSIVARTSDGGINWIPIIAPVGFTINCLNGIGNELWAFGGSGNIIYSSDFGNNWKLLNKVSGHTLYSIQSFDGEIIFASGMNGLFIKSTDFGKNWDNSFININGVSTNTLSMLFLNNSIGFTGHGNRLACKTIDGGQTWTSIIRDTASTSVYNNDIYFFDENNGFIVGTVGSNVDVIYKTSDGGQTWISQINQINENINCIAFSSPTNGVVGTNDSKIFYTTDAGNAWQAATLDLTSDLDIQDIEFIDELNGFAAGEKILLKTTNGGKNWSTVASFSTTKTMINVSFKNSTEGYVVGDRYIYKTTNGGTTWNNVNDTLITGTNSLRGIDFDNKGNTWICGGSGLIITDAPESTVSVEDNIHHYTFELSQNYPNPFNPSTKIKFNLAEGSLVSIKVYDMLGREIKTLINEYKNSGSHELIFDGEDLTSGIYFYVLRSAANSISKKMTLLK